MEGTPDRRLHYIQHQHQVYTCLVFKLGGWGGGGGRSCLFVCLFVCFLPLQVCPSPVYPALQLQEYEPTVFIQSAFTSQL